MASTVFDSALFRDMFGTAEMREIFSDEALVARYLEAEAALARAQGRLGVVPKEAALAIDAASRSLAIDYDKLRRETEIVGYPILPLVHQLSAAAGEAGRYVHWGATTQDIMDTGNVLQIRAALSIVERDLKEIGHILAGWRGNTGIRRWPAALIFNRRCPSPSATRRPSGCRRSTGISNASSRRGRACWSANSQVPPARSPRSAKAGWRCKGCSARNLGCINPRSPGMWRATASPKRCPCSA